LSVDAVQASDTVVLVLAETRRPVGAVGGVVSGAVEVVAVTAFDAADTLPAASKATTV
jgi:hypothetical protein